MSEFLYLLRNSEDNAFKIGVSVDPASRSKVLPQDINLAQSVQIPMADGAAYKVEHVLHYLFRQHTAVMPWGDGYTEWFDMAAWPEVLTFLDEQRGRLGVGEPEPIPSPITRPSAPVPDPAAIEARRLRVEAKKREAAKRQEERLAQATKHNGQTVAWLEAFMCELEAAGAIKGILVYNDLQLGPHGELAAKMFFVGCPTDVSRWFDDVTAGNEYRLMLADRGSVRRVFKGGFHHGGHHRDLAVIDVEAAFLTLPSDLVEHTPFAADAHRLLRPWTARKGSRLGPQLLRLLHLAAASRREMYRGMEQEWITGSSDRAKEPRRKSSALGHCRTSPAPGDHRDIP